MSSSATVAGEPTMVGPAPPMPMKSAMSRGVHSLSGSIFEKMSIIVWPSFVLTWREWHVGVELGHVQAASIRCSGPCAPV